MAAGMFERVHHHKEVVAIRCEDCGAWLDYQPAKFRLAQVRKLLRKLRAEEKEQYENPLA